jgi:hypothetical protein
VRSQSPERWNMSITMILTPLSKRSEHQIDRNDAQHLCFNMILPTMMFSSNCNDVVRMTDKRIPDCFHEDEKGILRPWVCMSCDSFVKKEKTRITTATRLSQCQTSFSPQPKSPDELRSHCTCIHEGLILHLFLL